MEHRTRSVLLGLTAAFISIGLPGTTLAQPPVPPGPMTFSALDTNGDGTVTEQEFATGHADRMASRAAQGAPMRGAANPPTFAAYDKNGDGKLTPDEFAAAQGDRRQQTMPPR
jgi:hypothetical protein